MLNSLLRQLIRMLISLSVDINDKFKDLTLLVNDGFKKASDERLSIRKEQLDQRVILDKILLAVEPFPAVGFEFDVEMEGQFFEKVDKIKMTNSQKATATITPKDKKGFPASVDGAPVWASSDETKGTVVAAPDGLSAEITAVGPLGDFDVSVTGDADLGEGVAPIFGKLTVTITQGAAVGFDIVLGEPSEQ